MATIVNYGSYGHNMKMYPIFIIMSRTVVKMVAKERTLLLLYKHDLNPCEDRT
jgi:hypothetical protein